MLHSKDYIDDYHPPASLMPTISTLVPYTLVICLSFYLSISIYMLVDVKSGVTGDTSSGSSTGRIISAIQGQRDRYMKASQDKEATLLVMKQRSDQMEDELMQLRNENMELFRRLRVLRVNQGQGNSSSGSSGSSSSSNSRYIHSTSSGSSEQIDRDDPNLMQLPSSAIYSSKVGVYTDSRCNPNHGVNPATSSSSSSGSSSSSNNSSGGIWNAIRSRRFNLIGGGGGGSLLSGEGDGEGELLSDDGTTHGGYDPLHEKYMGLYEQDISPFRIQQLDRQLVSE